MDAADPRIDYLSGTDCSRSNELHGLLVPESKESLDSSFYRGFYGTVYIFMYILKV